MDDKQTKGVDTTISADQQTTGGNTQVSADQPVKRKRGRPKGTTGIRPTHVMRRPKFSDSIQIIKDNMDQTDSDQLCDVSDDTVRQIVGRSNNQVGPMHDNAEPGDNARFLRLAMASLDLPPIDISDAKQVRNRILQYFNFCADNDRKPSMVGMANWIGVTRRSLTNWKRGEFGDERTPVIQNACAILEEMAVDYFQNGKVNPAAGIFMLKNHYGYKDVQDVVVSPNNPIGDAAQQKQLEDKYLDIVDVDENNE